MAAGDLLLFSRPTTLANFRADPLGTLMTALIHLTTRSRYNHAALDIGDGLMVEATNKGVAVNPIESTDEISRVEVWGEGEFGPGVACLPGYLTDLVYGGNDLEETLAVSTGMVGRRYGYINAFFCGLRSMWPGLQVKAGNTMICSELVALSLMYAGHRWDKDTALVSPGDLAEHFGVPRK